MSRRSSRTSRVSGVFGYLGQLSTERAGPVAERMGARMRHQPYHVVETAAPAADVALGRLGIGIFNRSPQPVRSGDGQVWLWLCGEFYHQQARQAGLARETGFSVADEAELALQVYLRQGAAGLSEFEGAFTLAVWDGRTAELLLVNDRYGLYPHYYAHVAGALAFAPEIKGMLEAPGLPRRLDLTAVAEYVRFQFLLGDRTWVDNVRVLPPASLLRYQPERAAARYKLSPAMLRALHAVESSSSPGGCLMNLRGSGAVGPFQFLPSTFRAYGVDADGDGRPNICGFADSLFTAAHYLHALGADSLVTSESTRRALKRYGTHPTRVIALATSGGKSSQAERAGPVPSDGARFRVVGTAGHGLNLRSAQSRGAARLKTLPEGAELLALGGVRHSDGHSWRHVRDQEATEGWVAAEFLTRI
jgi:hypothetical protein